MKPFRIFRPGKHTASCGTKVEFTEADLQRAVDAYNPALYAAPLVIGHPKQEDRCYGRAASLSYADGHLFAHPENVNPVFADLVQEGAYPSRSASWYMPNHPSNPVPGSLYPKHIGFLGAVPPSLKGLGDVEFAEQHPDMVVHFDAETSPDLVLDYAADDAAWSLSSVLGTMARMLRTLRDIRIEEKGVEAADQLIPDYVIQDADRAARDASDLAMKGAPALAYSAPTTPKDIAMTPEQIAALQAAHDAQAARLAQFAERETALAASERLALVGTCERELAPLVQAGRLLPKQVAPLAQFMAGLDAVAGVIEFGEAGADGTVPQVSQRAFLTTFLGTLPKQVDFTERTGPAAGNAGAITSAELANRASRLAAEHKTATGETLSYSEAVNRVLADGSVTVEAPADGPQV